MLRHPYLDKPLDFVKGVGPERAQLLAQELNILTVGDMLQYYPMRHEDRTKIYTIREAKANNSVVQLKGEITAFQEIGQKYKKRLVARFEDETDSIDLVWFRSTKWIKKNLKLNVPYLIHGKLNVFKGIRSIPHPELHLIVPGKAMPAEATAMTPIYSTTEKLSKRGLDSRGMRNIMKSIVGEIQPNMFEEYLPSELMNRYHFMAITETIKSVHFPQSTAHLSKARNRLKFEELFFVQMHLISQNQFRKSTIKGLQFESIGPKFNTFYSEHLGFELTGAQKRVLKEIRFDLGRAVQMNRLLQGDVGSGKTIVAIMTMLMAIDNGYQACLMAPTEILAQQHYDSMKAVLAKVGLQVGFLSGSIKGTARKELLRLLSLGEIHILIGTHALIEDPVQFDKLGLAVIDEQHRFGVAQRARLWRKGKELPPHILVMTATPIPRTLSMTIYGDLDLSIIDELPKGRKPIITVHRNETKRPDVVRFMKEEILKGRQIYIVYPLIEESEALDLEDLNNGYEKLLASFPRPDYQMSVVHGRMSAKDKDIEMQRFLKAETQIMVATTVIEVGVNVPNASVMIIENAERFGLSQLHQLRGRVGRGAEQSYCILMTKYALSQDARTRISTMCQTTDGFRIAEVDLKLRGPGNIQGTQQSGMPDFKIANLIEDQDILMASRKAATSLLNEDPKLLMERHQGIKQIMQEKYKMAKLWSKIS